MLPIILTFQFHTKPFRVTLSQMPEPDNIVQRSLRPQPSRCLILYVNNAISSVQDNYNDGFVGIYDSEPGFAETRNFLQGLSLFATNTQLDNSAFSVGSRLRPDLFWAAFLVKNFCLCDVIGPEGKPSL